MRVPMIITDARKIYDAGSKKTEYKIAKKMLLDGVSDEVILKYFDLTPEQLEEIKAKISKTEISKS